MSIGTKFDFEPFLNIHLEVVMVTAISFQSATDSLLTQGFLIHQPLAGSVV
jgi:hypothetical protein